MHRTILINDEIYNVDTHDFKAKIGDLCIVNDFGHLSLGIYAKDRPNAQILSRAFISASFKKDNDSIKKRIYKNNKLIRLATDSLEDLKNGRDIDALIAEYEYQFLQNNIADLRRINQELNKLIEA